MSFFFSFTKSESRRVKQVLLGGAYRRTGVGTSARGEEWGKYVGKWIQCKYCVHMYVNGKMIPVVTIAGIVRWG
jgi:hypothetical protein